MNIVDDLKKLVTEEPDQETLDLQAKLKDIDSVEFLKGSDKRWTWDMCMAFEIGDASKKAHVAGKQEEFTQEEAFAVMISESIYQLDKAGLKTLCFKSSDGKYVFCLVGSPEGRLCIEADRIDYDLRLIPEEIKAQGEKMGTNLINMSMDSNKDDPAQAQKYQSFFDTVYGKYKIQTSSTKNPDLYKLYKRYNTQEELDAIKKGDLKTAKPWEFEPKHPNSYFRTTDRLKLTMSIIENEEKFGGAGLSPAKSCADKKHPMASLFCLHQDAKKEHLKQKWLHKWYWGRPLIMQPLEDIRNYFGEQIAMYFAWLGYYSFLLLFIAIPGIPIFFLCMDALSDYLPVWISGLRILFSLYVALWATLFLEWWSRRQSMYRVNWGMEYFLETEQPRPEFHGNWEYSEINGKIEEVFPLMQKIFRLFVSQVVVWSLIACVCAVVGIIFWFKYKLYQAYGLKEGILPLILTKVVPPVLNSVQITIFNIIYASVSEKLNDYENHRTDSQFENAKIAKSFLFKFINSYNSFFYIAYLKRMVEGDAFEGTVISELTMQLSIIFILQITLNNALEFIKPWAEKKKTEKENKEATRVKCSIEKQFGMAPYEGTFDDFDEMIIQFGFVTLFVVAFPLTPLLALINNVLELFLDSTKVCDLTRRPEPRGCENIGTWSSILTVISIIAVLNNVALVCFVDFKAIKDIIGNDDLDPKLFFIILEHLLILAKFLIAYLIPDEPSSVADTVQRNKYIVSVLIDGIHDERDVFSAEKDEDGNTVKEEKVDPKLDQLLEKDALQKQMKNIKELVLVKAPDEHDLNEPEEKKENPTEVQMSEV